MKILKVDTNAGVYMVIWDMHELHSQLYLYKSSQTYKKGVAHAKKDSMKKVVKSKVAAQKWL